MGNFKEISSFSVDVVVFIHNVMKKLTLALSELFIALVRTYVLAVQTTIFGLLVL